MATRGLLIPILLGLILALAMTVVAQPRPAFTIFFVHDGQLASTSRSGVLSGDPQTDATELLRALVAGPTPSERAKGHSSPLPPDSELVAVRISADAATVDLDLPQSFLHDVLDPNSNDTIVRQVASTLHPLGMRHIHVRARKSDGSFVPISQFLPPTPAIEPTLPTNDDAAPDRLGRPGGRLAGQPPIPGQGQPWGALSGRTVWLSAGHGWYWSDTLNRWTTQRGNNHGLVEDFSNAEAVNYYLARYLWNAGAEVWLVRDRSMTEHEIIVDNDTGAPGYVETGDWVTSSWPGYGGGTYRWAGTFAVQSATATWRPDLPSAGIYPVWVWYRHGANRSTDTRYEIHHAGGVTTVSLSQEVHGQTWRYLGEYYFDAGMAGHVTLVNGSDDPGQAAIADAVRFGGGLGSIPEPGGASGRPRWEEAAKYWVQYQGAPAEISAYDRTSRPLYAEWEAAKGYPDEAQNAVYISWHTNAGGGTGTESYIHNVAPSPGSAELQRAIHTELIHDLRSAWNTGWVDRGQKSADFSEVRELSTMPGVLLEIAFHDTEDPGDADDLREPLFRQIAARAVYQGIVGYAAQRTGAPMRLLPEPPVRLTTRNTSAGQVTLTWAPPPCCDGVVGDAATAYKVYQSVDGRAFDNGTETVTPSLTLTDLAPGSLRFFRVTALNEGGESFPTPVVAVRTSLNGQSPQLLLVDGFDRLDQAAMVPQWEAPFLGTDKRMFLERMNRYDYAVEHALALRDCGLAFDGAVNEAIEFGDIVLDDYAAVDWFVGRDSVADESLSAAERTRLAQYLDGGGSLLLSGAEIGYDLVQNGRDPSFFRDYLRSGYLGDGAETYEFTGVPGTAFAGLSGRFDDGQGSTYDVGQPDRLAAISGSAEILQYEGGLGGAAAVAYGGDFRVVHFGFPLETVNDPAVRSALFCGAADYLLSMDEPQDHACSERLINPGFEGGTDQTAWQVNDSRGSQAMVQRSELPEGVAPDGGDWLAWLGARDPGLHATTILSQSVALPPGDPSATLTLSWLAHPVVSTPSITDTLSADIHDLNGVRLANVLTVTQPAVTDTWQTAEVDVGAFAGEHVQVVLRSASSGTAFFVDDVSLTTCGPPGADEYRALWVDAYHDGIKSPQQIDELVETARAGNVNALVVQVRRRGDTYYPSALSPWAPDADPGFDALRYLIERAHAAGIEVHAWATTLAIWNGLIPPSPLDHAFNRHGPGSSGRDYWLMTNATGADQAADGDYYLDPGHPDVVDYTVAVYAELAANYDLDGIHLDRVRYPGRGWGYNPTALGRFQAQMGRGDVPDPLDEEWLQWRRDQVTALVRKIYLTTTAIDPGLRVSAALSSVGDPPSERAPWESRDPYAHHLQDWRAWSEEGILDLAMPMTYRDDDIYAAGFDGWIAWQKDHQYDRGTVVGTGLYLNAIQDSLSQWRRVRQPSSAGHQVLGMSGYSYATPSDEGVPQRDFVNAAVTQVFTQSASPPLLPWKDTPALGHLMGVVTPSLPCRPEPDGFPLALVGPLPESPVSEPNVDRAVSSHTLLTDGSGWFGMVDLAPGPYLLVADILTPSQTISIPMDVVAGIVSEKHFSLPACPQPSQFLYLPLILGSPGR